MLKKKKAKPSVCLKMSQEKLGDLRHVGCLEKSSKTFFSQMVVDFNGDFTMVGRIRNKNHPKTHIQVHGVETRK